MLDNKLVADAELGRGMQNGIANVDTNVGRVPGTCSTFTFL
jgi:hypothetical protein